MARLAAFFQTVKNLQHPAERNRKIRKVRGLRPTAQLLGVSLGMIPGLNK